MTKDSYDLLENFKKMEKKIEKSSVHLIIAFGHEINDNTIQKQTKKLKCIL